MPLAQVGDLPEQLETWVQAAVSGKVARQPILAGDGKAHLGEACERRRSLSAETETGTLQWGERVLIVRSAAHAKAAVQSLHKRLAQAQAKLRHLTPPRTRGQRQFTEKAELQTAVNAILERYDVTGLLTVALQPETEQRTVRTYRKAPAWTETRHRDLVKVKENRTQLRKRELCLGWRVYVTNAPARKLPLQQAVLAYRYE
jgi:transposase